ncbi:MULTISPECIES: hypothetical protein [unclassified Beijerinckia]|uniref:hypothetical protein n=1 Tax=unclassified Beijerinckia TaxID=2638183 RepID=UPI00089A9466|nr:MULTISPECIES: hypothetical protein [unclassified Beijerinckia]MDH7797601.1 hypothetical protein [Beijerinckia sp. GAS462]SEC91954.1 hypothetical protein SAMN05443249_3894 [Beijerinckia sp. 28-YEA-48]
MTDVTYYVALPFVANEEGDLVAGEARDFQSGYAATRGAKSMAAVSAGAIAFSRTGDPTAGDFAPAVIIARFGETPNEVE